MFCFLVIRFFFFNDTATTEIYTLSLTTLFRSREEQLLKRAQEIGRFMSSRLKGLQVRSEEHTSELQSRSDLVCRLLLEKKKNVVATSDRAVLLNGISSAVTRKMSCVVPTCSRI